MKQQYAFVLLGSEYNPDIHRATFETSAMVTHIRTACTFEQAKEVISELYQGGVGAVEVCGAFGEERARELIALTNHQVAIGFVTHLPEQDALFHRFFGA